MIKESRLWFAFSTYSFLTSTWSSFRECHLVWLECSRLILAVRSGRVTLTLIHRTHRSVALNPERRPHKSVRTRARLLRFLIRCSVLHRCLSASWRTVKRRPPLADFQDESGIAAATLWTCSTKILFHPDESLGWVRSVHKYARLARVVCNGQAFEIYDAHTLDFLKKRRQRNSAHSICTDSDGLKKQWEALHTARSILAF